jgi:hypothetical protein
LSRLGVLAPGQPSSVTRSIARAIRRAMTIGVILASIASAEWVTPRGKTYHTRRACIALRTTEHPEEISVKEALARGLKLCAICNHNRNSKK